VHFTNEPKPHNQPTADDTENETNDLRRPPVPCPPDRSPHRVPPDCPEAPPNGPACVVDIRARPTKNHRQSQAHNPNHQNTLNNTHDIHIKFPFILTIQV